MGAARRAVVFDIGGVLLSYVGGESVEARWEQRLNLAPGTFNRLVWDLALARGGEIGRTPEPIWWAEATTSLGLDAEAARELYEDTWAITYLDPRVEAYVRSLRPAFLVATLSNAFSEARAECVRRYRLDELVDLMVFSAEEGVAKPDRAIYELTLARLGVEARNALFVDDRLDNLAAAQQVGMRTLHITNAEDLLSRVPAALDAWA